MRIAHVSPLPPQQTGIADYCASLLPYLAEEVDVDLFGMPETAVSNFPVYPITALPERCLYYDLCLYHMGNHPNYHLEIFDMAMRYPGVVVLHEVNLHSFFAVQPTAVYMREMGFSGGLAGVDQALRVREAGQLPPVSTYPLIDRIWQTSLGVIVHTQAAYEVLAKMSVKRPLHTIPLAVEIPTDTVLPRPDLLADLPPDTCLLGSFGHIAPSKRLESIFAAMAQLTQTDPSIRLVLVGNPIDGYDLSGVIAQLGLEDSVIQTGFVAKDEYEAYLQHIDIGVNLRSQPTGGEMSASLLDLLAHGKPVLVSDVDGFQSLPETAVFKIPQDEQEIVCIIAALQQLVQDNDLCKQVGQAAKTYVQTNCSFTQTAQKMGAFLQVCQQTAVQGTSDS